MRRAHRPRLRPHDQDGRLTHRLPARSRMTTRPRHGREHNHQGRPRMNPIRPLGPAVKAEVAAEYNGLPHGRITDRGGEAQVFTASLAELELWFLALGGRITRQTAGSTAALWTL